MAVFRVSALDERINKLQEQIAALEADYVNQRAGKLARLAALRAIRARITPEMEQLLTQLNAALEQ